LEFNLYKAACVRHTEENTVLSKTLHPMAFNYAAYEGNKMASSGIQAYDYDSNQICASRTSSSQSKYVDIVNNIASTNGTFQVRDFSMLVDGRNCFLNDLDNSLFWMR
jgi:hypothetical protein